MFITIQKSLQLYYKQRLLVQDLEETKKELELSKKIHDQKQIIESFGKQLLAFAAMEIEAESAWSNALLL